ncbi:hypothetical protein [Enhygromyxa salina]|uniref:hypothetical protein n=1 Tax=Enhygromyxa salina TaxID=215803 RepID=UPI0011BA531B|nr:hypothetical protein [Enhygromyxa salina]
MVLASAGLGFGVLTLMGELEPFTLLFSGLLLALAGLAARHLPGDWSRTVTLTPDGLRMQCRGELTEVRWEDVTKLSFVKPRDEVVGMVLQTTSGKQLTLGEDLTDWDSVQSTVSKRLGVSPPASSNAST